MQPYALDDLRATFCAAHRRRQRQRYLSRAGVILAGLAALLWEVR
jgi:hypothetical protein